MRCTRVFLFLVLATPLAACGDRATSLPAAEPGALVIEAFTADPGRVSAPETPVVLTWKIEGSPTSLTLAPNIGPVTGLSARVAPTRTTTYTLTAKNAKDARTAEVTVTVERPAASPVEPAPPDDPNPPDPADAIPMGRWAFEVTASGEGKSDVLSGVLLANDVFSYNGSSGVYGGLEACSFNGAACQSTELGGIFYTETGALRFAVGTTAYVPNFSGDDADGAFSRDGGERFVLEGQGKLKDDPATFRVSLLE